MLISYIVTSKYYSSFIVNLLNFEQQLMFFFLWQKKQFIHYQLWILRHSPSTMFRCLKQIYL